MLVNRLVLNLKEAGARPNNHDTSFTQSTFAVATRSFLVDIGAPLQVGTYDEDYEEDTEMEMAPVYTGASAIGNSATELADIEAQA